MGGLPWALRKAKGDQLTVLSFHRITNEEDFFFSPIRPEDFERLLHYLIKHYSIIGFKDVDKDTPKPKLILSFDDGYYDFVENVLPLIIKHKLSCNMNVVNACLNNNHIIWTQQLNDLFNYLRTNSIVDSKIIEKYSPGFAQCGGDWIRYHTLFFRVLLNMKKTERDSIINELLSQYPARQTYRMMNWTDAALCVQHGVEIGCHTYTHDSLKTLRSEVEIDTEVKRSVDELEARLKIRVNIVALPNGQYNEQVLNVCAKNNIDYVLASNDKTTSKEAMTEKGALIGRIHMIDESVPAMILRSELFHGRLR